MRIIIEWIENLLTPSQWVVIGTYSGVWDRELQSLISSDNFYEIGRFYAKIGCHTVWIANHPYGSFSITVGGEEVVPSRATVRKAFKKLTSDAMLAARDAKP